MDKLFDIYKISSSFNVLTVICAFRIFRIYRKDEKFRIFADTIRTVTPPSFKIVWDGDVFRFMDYVKGGVEGTYKVVYKDQFYIIEDRIIDYINNLLVRGR